MIEFTKLLLVSAALAWAIHALSLLAFGYTKDYQVKMGVITVIELILISVMIAMTPIILPELLWFFIVAGSVMLLAAVFMLYLSISVAMDAHYGE
jgi:hypothetical protein